jgi:hypothetical protein
LFTCLEEPDKLTNFLRFAVSCKVAIKFKNKYSMYYKWLASGKGCSVLSGMSVHNTLERSVQGCWNLLTV